MNQSILDLYNIDKEDIMTGVFCSNCNQLSMNRIYGTWLCPHCYEKKKEAHLDTIYQYYLLFGQEITNRQLRDFLRISSHSLSTRILNSVAPTTRGKNKDKVHILNLDKRK